MLSKTNSLNSTASPPATRAVVHLVSILRNDARVDDILALSSLLHPVDLSHQVDGKTLLRWAVERAPSNGAFSFEQLSQLASFGFESPQIAWEKAGDLKRWLLYQLSSVQYLPVSEVCTFLATRPEFLTDDAVGDALLAHSTPTKIGPKPYLAWLHARGFNMGSAKKSNGTRAVLSARAPELFDAFLAAGGDALQLIKPTTAEPSDKPEPLWELLQQSAGRQHDTALLSHLEAWSLAHAGGRVAEREKDAYFESLSRYRGAEHLKSRKDWTEILGPRGRSAPLAVCWGGAPHIKSFWSVKKAHTAAACVDEDGRCLVHAMVALGKLAPDGTTDYLAALFPEAPLDKQGRGILPSLYFMPAEGSGREGSHEWFFRGPEGARAGQAWPKASDWFACPDPKMAAQFAHWMNNKRHLGFSSTSSFGRGPSREVEELTKLCLNLDASSFSVLDPLVAGALAYNLALHCVPYGVDIEIGRGLCREILAQGARVEASSERMELLRKSGDPGCFALIESSIFIANEALAIGGMLGKPQLAAPTPVLRI